MSVPHRQLYRVLFSKEVAAPASRMGFIKAHRPLYPNIPYVMTGVAYERMLVADPQAVAEMLHMRPMTEKTQRLLVFFPGGIGDVICLNAALRAFRKANPHVSVAVVSTVSDKSIVDAETVLWEYPVTETIANHYDAWINVAEHDRESVGQELCQTFAQHLGMDAPEQGPVIRPDGRLMAAMAEYLRDQKQYRVGVQLASAYHYRSIPPVMGCRIMMDLVERGCECYVLGTPENAVNWTQKVYDDAGNVIGKTKSEPPPHIYDMTTVLGPVENTIAFTALMDVVLTPDTGTLHIAGALGKPSVGIFGMTEGCKRTKYNPVLRVIQGEAECAPCYKLAEDVPCDEPWCRAVMDLDTEMIADNVMGVLCEYAETDGSQHAEHVTSGVKPS